jgi:hypothetical protein
MKVVLTFLAALMTVSPSSSHMNEINEKNKSNIITQSNVSAPNDTETVSRLDKSVHLLNWFVNQTSSSLTPHHFDFKSGLQFLPIYKPGDEKPIYIPTEWINKQMWLWQKCIDQLLKR